MKHDKACSTADHMKVALKVTPKTAKSSAFAIFAEFKHVPDIRIIEAFILSDF